jgi:hypothetical protein
VLRAASDQPLQVVGAPHRLVVEALDDVADPDASALGQGAWMHRRDLGAAPRRSRTSRWICSSVRVAIAVATGDYLLDVSAPGRLCNPGIRPDLLNRLRASLETP